jgi:hypothetical protein
MSADQPQIIPDLPVSVPPGFIEPGHTARAVQRKSGIDDGPASISYGCSVPIQYHPADWTESHVVEDGTTTAELVARLADLSRRHADKPCTHSLTIRWEVVNHG